MKPIAKTDSCEAPHFQYHVSGQLAIRMDDGTEFIAGPGDVTSLPSGHDAWVVGDTNRGRGGLVRGEQLRQVSRPNADMEPVKVVEVFAAAWAEDDLEGTLALVTDDCIFDATGPAPDGTRCVGRAAIRQAWGPIFGGHLYLFDAEETFVADDRVVQLWRYSWNGGHVRGVDVFRVREGKVAEKFSYVKG